VPTATRPKIIYDKKNILPKKGVSLLTNVSGRGYNSITQKEMRNKMDKNQYICAFDGTITWAYICPTCNDYKGLSTIAEAIREQPWMIEEFELQDYLEL
jgi:hypothetical protein